MDELESRLRRDHDEAQASLPDAGAEVVATVRRGARRRRQLRAVATGAAAVMAIGAIGVGAWGLTFTDRADGLQPMVSDTPTPEASPLPRVSAAATSSPASATGSVEVTAGPPLDDSPDGIPEDGYPPLAPERGVLEPEEPGSGSAEPYPTAHLLEDWVWDRVGPGWALDIASVQQYVYADEWEQPAAVMYLVSPEDRYFEITELPERAWNDARVVSWREELGTAMIWWGADAEGRGIGGGAGAVDLRTGELDDLVMAVYGETAHGYRFIMANESGDELWRAESDAGVKYYRWSQGADDDGWVASALVDDEPTADRASSSIGHEQPTTTAGGDRVLLRRAGESDELSTVATLVTYDLAADTVQTFRFTGLPPGARLEDALFLDPGTVETDLWYYEEPFSDPPTHASAQHRVRFALDGSGRMTRVSEGDATWEEWTERAMVRYGEASDPSVAREECGC